MPAGTVFGVGYTGGGPCPPVVICGPQFLAATPDDQHVVLKSKVALTETRLPENSSHETPAQLYEWNAADPPSKQLQLVSLLPPTKAEEEKHEGGAPASNASLGGGDNEDARGAISSDGSRVFWNAGSALYMRDVLDAKTLRLDLPQAGCAAEGTCGTGTAGATFQLASSEGTKVFFTDAQRLTADSGARGADLYECEISESAGGPKCELFDLTPKSTTGESASVLGSVIGESEDGSYLYFVANGVLENNGTSILGAVHGTCKKGGTELCNLYVRHDGTTSLVAVLSGGDFPDWAFGGSNLAKLTARVSPTGEYLAFMSDRELTGYDNHDAASGEPDEEVYEYDATTGHLSCGSCDPSGARPVGVQDGTGHSALVEGEEVWNPASSWLAADLPG